jgi:DinB superfamily
MDFETLISHIDSSPARFAVVLSRLEAADSVEVTRPGEWSAAEVLAHVRTSQDIIEPRVMAILARDNPPLPAYDETVWMEVGRYAFVSVPEALEIMRLKRRELVRVLKSIPPEAWNRTGIHEVRGPLSVMEIVRGIAQHEDEHIEQIARSATAYADADLEIP